MHNKEITFGRNAATLFASTIILMILTQAGQAQTFSVIHNFSGPDGIYPIAGLTLDRVGNLYGTTEEGGLDELGTVFQLTHSNGGWVLNNLYSFQRNVGSLPMGRVVFGPDGALYGLAQSGGMGPCEEGCGSVYNLRPPSTRCKSAICPWTATAIYSFNGTTDGFGPMYVDPVFDQAGNLYGTTPGGGAFGLGLVFQLTPSHEAWTESVLHNFSSGDSDGYIPKSGLTLDRAGNLYGTASAGGTHNYGIVYQLTNSGSGWTETALYSFQGAEDGANPVGPVLTPSGNLYGTTPTGGALDGGTVFELLNSGGNWTCSLLYGLSEGLPNNGPQGNLAMDSAGNLYGTTAFAGTFGQGSVFKLTPSDGGWTYTSLHDFTGQSDGGEVTAGVTIDASGNLYGTAVSGGSHGIGVVWEITP